MRNRQEERTDALTAKMDAVDFFKNAPKEAKGYDILDEVRAV